MLWGGEDLSAELGATANRDASGAYTAPFALARSLCLLAARAAGVAPIDAVFTDFRDSDGLAREANAARRDGFSAKAAIHPSQIAIINTAFTYTAAERAWAQRIVDALAASSAGVVQIEGVMIDAPHLAQARRILGAPAATS
jgi:citrate lyase subunit beta/citryl-CoA lyase